MPGDSGYARSLGGNDHCVSWQLATISFHRRASCSSHPGADLQAPHATSAHLRHSHLEPHIRLEQYDLGRLVPFVAVKHQTMPLMRATGSLRPLWTRGRWVHCSGAAYTDLHNSLSDGFYEVSKTKSKAEVGGERPLSRDPEVRSARLASSLGEPSYLANSLSGTPHRG